MSDFADYQLEFELHEKGTFSQLHFRRIRINRLLKEKRRKRRAADKK